MAWRFSTKKVVDLCSCRAPLSPFVVVAAAAAVVLSLSLSLSYEQRIRIAIAIASPRIASDRVAAVLTVRIRKLANERGLEG